MVSVDFLDELVLRLHLIHQLLYLVSNDPQHICQKELLLVLTPYHDNLTYDVVQILNVTHVKSQLLYQHLVLLHELVGTVFQVQDHVQYIFYTHHLSLHQYNGIYLELMQVLKYLRHQQLLPLHQLQLKYEFHQLQ